MYEPFEVTTSSFAVPQMGAYKLDHPTMGLLLAIRYERDEVVVITKEQAMRFFGLVEPA